MWVFINGYSPFLHSWEGRPGSTNGLQQCDICWCCWSQTPYTGRSVNPWTDYRFPLPDPCTDVIFMVCFFPFQMCIDCQKVGVCIYLANCNGKAESQWWNVMWIETRYTKCTYLHVESVLKILTSSGLMNYMNPQHIFVTVHDAVVYIRHLKVWLNDRTSELCSRDRISAVLCVWSDSCHLCFCWLQEKTPDTTTVWVWDVPFLTDPTDDTLIRAGPFLDGDCRVSPAPVFLCQLYVLEARRDLTKPLHLLICLISTPSIRWGRGANYWHQMLWCLVSRRAVERQSSGLQGSWWAPVWAHVCSWRRLLKLSDCMPEFQKQNRQKEKT